MICMYWSSESRSSFLKGTRFTGIDLEFDISGIDHDITLIIDDVVELLGRKAEQISDLVGERAEIPYMSHRHHQLDMSHAFAAHLLLGDLDTAPVAHDTFVAYALVLSAMAFEVLDRTEYLLAEKSVALRLVGAVVDGLGLEHLSA